MKFGAKLDSQIYEPWIEHYISYKRLKRILSKIEVQQQKAKRASERERERQSKVGDGDQVDGGSVNSSSPRPIVNSVNVARSMGGGASPLSLADASLSTSPAPPSALARSVSSTKYTSPLVRAYGSNTSTERPPSPPPLLALPRSENGAFDYDLLVDDNAPPDVYGTNRTSSPYSTPPLGMQGAQTDARPEFFAVIEDDIRRINKFYKERVATLLREVQGFQDEHRPTINSSTPERLVQAAQMFNTPIDAYYQLSSGSGGKSTTALPPMKAFSQPASDESLSLLLADPSAPGDDLPALQNSKNSPASKDAKAAPAGGVFPPSSGIPKLNLDSSSLFGADSKHTSSSAKGAPEVPSSSSITALLDHRPLSEPVYALYGSAEDGDISSMTDEQRQEYLTSQAERLHREKKLVHVFQELQRLKFFVELNYIGFGKIMKKYERVTGERMRRAFMQRLDQEDFFRSSDLGALIQLTETLFYVVSDGRRISEVAAMMAAPQKAAKTEYIFKPRILLFALVIFFILFFVPLLGDDNVRAHRCIVLMGVVIVMWVTEAVPYFVTALFIPVLTVLLGILADATGKPLSPEDAAKEVFSKMFDHTIALVLGGFAISSAFSKFQFELHLATYIQSKTADRPYMFIFAFMLLGFVLSMFINNVAAPVLCLTVLLPIIRDLPRESPFARCSLLALAFACNIGGMLTPISSPQNTVSLAELSRQDPAHEISFMGWVSVAVPFGFILLVTCWGFLILALRPNDVLHVPEILHADSDSALSVNHYVVLVVSGITILLWCTFSLTKPFFGDLGVIGLLPIVVFFGTGLLSKQDFNNFSWNLIYLLGGGNVLGDAVSSSGLLKLVTDQIAPQLQSQSEFVVVIAFCGFVAVVTTFVSHTVAAIIIMPIVVKIGIAINHSQVVLFASALMCSGAMALPMTSFPNINSLLAEDDYGRPYLQVADFLKYGGIFSGITLAMLITVGFGLIKWHFG